MAQAESTCWTVIVATAGSAGARAEFARRYRPVVGAYLASCWRSLPCQEELDDAQDAFVECFKQGGALEGAECRRVEGFRPFLFGVVRNVALRLERARGRRREQSSADGLWLEAVADDDPGLSRAFDRAWATTLVRQAGRLQEQQAEQKPRIRDIARRWGGRCRGVPTIPVRRRKSSRSARTSWPSLG